MMRMGFPSSSTEGRCARDEEKPASGPPPFGNGPRSSIYERDSRLRGIGGDGWNEVYPVVPFLYCG